MYKTKKQMAFFFTAFMCVKLFSFLFFCGKPQQSNNPPSFGRESLRAAEEEGNKISSISKQNGKRREKQSGLHAGLEERIWSFWLLCQVGGWGGLGQACLKSQLNSFSFSFVSLSPFDIRNGKSRSRPKVKFFYPLLLFLLLLRPKRIKSVKSNIWHGGGKSGRERGRRRIKVFLP